jgi:hypothetical protein
MVKEVTSLQRIIQLKSGDPGWLGFVKYCESKEKGLRKLALTQLDQFIKTAQTWGFDVQKQFAIDFFSYVSETTEYYEVLTHPLEIYLKTVLEHWIIENPSDPRPYRWMGMYVSGTDIERLLKRAIELGGNEEQEAIIRLSEFYIKGLEFGTHELPSGYCGLLHEDQENLPFVIELIHRISNEEIRSDLMNELVYYFSLIVNWLRNTPSPVDAEHLWSKEQIEVFEHVVASNLGSI